MANVRFKTTVQANGQLCAIVDRAEGRAHAYGLAVYASFCGSHRREYSALDAQAVCDMLNQREATATS